ncbi:MAG: DNA-binding protein [Candidatus Gracilibacteria bacterium]|nr:DNA-binding protein [Candidatus Gracilibacteria bacterium]
MKIIHTSTSQHLLAFEIGDEVMTGLKSYATETGLKSAWVNILGASKEVTLAFYDLEKKEYRTKTFDEELEIVTVVGNITWFNGEIAVHLHGSFGREDMSLVGGHIMNMKISATGETHLQLMDEMIERAHCNRTGLNLMRCKG